MDDRRPHSERWIEVTLLIMTGLSAVAIFSILILLGYFCLPLLRADHLARVLSWHWQPFGGEFGILPMCLASLALATLTLLLAFPMAMGICCLVHFLAPRPLARFFLGLTHFMTSIPTVVYGFVSVFLLVPVMRDWLHAGSGFTLLTAALTLTLLTLPTIVLVFNARLEQMDATLRLSAEAMGMTPVQQFRHVAVPAAGQGLAVAAILGFARALGDTLISLMLAGNAAQLPDSLFASVRTLTAHITLVLATDTHSMIYQSVFASGLILFLIMGTINSLIRRSWKSGRGYSHGSDL